MTLNLATILSESGARYAQRTALIDADRTITFRELDDAARRLAGAFVDSGVKRGDVVALMLPNVPAFTVAYFAAHYAGAIVVPLNVLLTADEVAYHLTDSGAVALVAWERAQLGAPLRRGARTR